MAGETTETLRTELLVDGRELLTAEQKLKVIENRMTQQLKIAEEKQASFSAASQRFLSRSAIPPGKSYAGLRSFRGEFRHEMHSVVQPLHLAGRFIPGADALLHPIFEVSHWASMGLRSFFGPMLPIAFVTALIGVAAKPIVDALEDRVKEMEKNLKELVADNEAVFRERRQQILQELRELVQKEFEKTIVFREGQDALREAKELQKSINEVQ